MCRLVLHGVLVRCGSWSVISGGWAGLVGSRAQCMLPWACRLEVQLEGQLVGGVQLTERWCRKLDTKYGVLEQLHTGARGEKEGPVGSASDGP